MTRLTSNQGTSLALLVRILRSIGTHLIVIAVAVAPHSMPLSNACWSVAARCFELAASLSDLVRS